MTTVLRSPTPQLQFLNNCGQPNVGGSLLTQVGGVNYTTYQDAAGTIALPNPIPLNSRGEISNSAGASCELWLVSGVSYTLTLYDSAGNQIGVYPNVTGILDQASVLAPLALATGAALVGYLPAGTGAVATTVWTKLHEIVSVLDFGATGDWNGTTGTDDTAAVQLAINYAATNGRKLRFIGMSRIRSTLTIPTNGYINWEGEKFGTWAGGITDGLKSSGMVFDPSGADTYLVNNTTSQVYISLVDMTFDTISTSQLNGIKFGILGTYVNPSQTSLYGPSQIRGCAFRGWVKGCALTLGGEVFATIEQNAWSGIRQAICVNGAGEITFRNNQVIGNATSGIFTPQETEATALCYFAMTTTKFMENIVQSADDLYGLVKFYNCDEVVVGYNKTENPGMTTATYHVIEIKSDVSSSTCRNAVIEGNTLVRSSLGAVGYVGRFVATTLLSTGRIYHISILNNVFSYSAAAIIPCVDLSTGKPDAARFGGNQWKNYLVRILSGASPAGAKVPWAGLTFDEAQYFSVRSQAITGLTATAIGQTPAFFFAGPIYKIHNMKEEVQIFPLTISSEADAGLAGANYVNFYLSSDTAKAQIASHVSTDDSGYSADVVYQPMVNFNSARDSSVRKVFIIQCDTSGASPAANYIINFTYMTLPDYYNAPGTRGMLEIV